jgi:ABC-type cobalamin/Fe3+-siderophores transport system ATPase subunit
MQVFNAPTAPESPIITGLRDILAECSNKRVVVLGTTCTGKTTMVKNISGARDQDKEVFLRLTPSERALVCKTPWTKDIGREMNRLVRKYVASKIGEPVFGTVAIDCDFVVLLRISDTLLQQRATQRRVSFLDAKNMQFFLEAEVRSKGIPWIEYSVG